MKIRLITILLLALSLAACDSSVDKDGVPKVDIHGEIVETPAPKPKAAWLANAFPKVIRTRIITVQDKKMPLQEFILTYCQGKSQNETCSRAMKIANLDLNGGPRKDLPKGL